MEFSHGRVDFLHHKKFSKILGDKSHSLIIIDNVSIEHMGIFKTIKKDFDDAEGWSIRLIYTRSVTLILNRVWVKKEIWKSNFKI